MHISLKYKKVIIAVTQFLPLVGLKVAVYGYKSINFNYFSIHEV